ncbi:unnamed protein product [Microthlaspi erraticum]|uniref:F-box domain-containing protein n=1 Tax=Microthlaspi erraticum TaxID=1685480 RepID=A0A6D2J5S8_9BRAS|nr:unnamed protein product [Microthlaspi erraticum]
MSTFCYQLDNLELELRYFVHPFGHFANTREERKSINGESSPTRNLILHSHLYQGIQSLFLNLSMSPPPKKRKKTTVTRTKKLRPTQPQSTPILIMSERPQRKLTQTPPQSTPILSLPDDLLLNCIARVSRLYYPTLSLVSKSFRSLIASPELYKVRSLLGRTESCLYVCLWCGSKYRWFTLSRKPDKTLTKDSSEKKSCGYVLATASIPTSGFAIFQSIVAVGSNIYNINPYGKYRADTSTGPVSVSILDCRSHTWRETSSMFRVKRTVENGKLNNKTLCIDGKFHGVLLDSVLAYDSEEGRWDEVLYPGMNHYMVSNSYCEIDNVLYSAAYGVIRWYDTEESMWREVMGLVGLPELPHGERIDSGVRLADYGGKMAVFWGKIAFYDPNATIVWCAEIALERCQPCQIWGKVEWFDSVLKSYHDDIVKVVAATL